jgi:hypothetical protein
MVLMDHGTKGARQSDTKQRPKTSPITLLFMTNVACIVPLTLELLVSITSNLANLGVYEPM